jgi:hypothetical protein
MRGKIQNVAKAAVILVIAAAVASVAWKATGPMLSLAQPGCNASFTAADYVIDRLPNDWKPSKSFHAPCFGLCPDFER